jgi:hypothetical protein
MNDDAKYREFEEALTDVLAENEYILARPGAIAWRSPTGRYCREAGGQDCLNAFGQKFIHERRQTREFLIRRVPLKLDRASLDPSEAFEGGNDRTGSWRIVGDW